MIAVSAMEAVGVGAAMERFQSISGNPKVKIHSHLSSQHKAFDSVLLTSTNSHTCKYAPGVIRVFEGGLMSHCCGTLNAVADWTPPVFGLIFMRADVRLPQ